MICARNKGKVGKEVFLHTSPWWLCRKHNKTKRVSFIPHFWEIMKAKGNTKSVLSQPQIEEKAFLLILVEQCWYGILWKSAATDSLGLEGFWNPRKQGACDLGPCQAAEPRRQKSSWGSEKAWEEGEKIRMPCCEDSCVFVNQCETAQDFHRMVVMGDGKPDRIVRCTDVLVNIEQWTFCVKFQHTCWLKLVLK